MHSTRVVDAKDEVEIELMVTRQARSLLASRDRRVDQHVILSPPVLA